MHLAEIQFDVYNFYKVDAYLASMGLSVHPDYRGRGIAVEMLKAREEILRFLELKLTSTQFTGVGSQKSALKAGFEENSTIT
jgi:GNAT superfamily N-acetyltransferase